LAGAFCTKLLAGLGATIVKIEPVERGDPMRSVGPFVHGEEGLERSIPFLWLNTGKQSATLNLNSARGISLLKQLIRQADVLVESFAPGFLNERSLGVNESRRSNPRLVFCSISNYGQTGPYRDYLAEEIALYAMAGAMHLTGEKQAPPLGPGPAVSQYTAGSTACLAVLMALFQRELSGGGEYIDVSVFESAIDLVETSLIDYLQKGKAASRGSHSFAPWGLFPCQDGYVAVISAPFRNWRRAAAIFEEPRLQDPKYGEVRDRVRYREELDDLLQPWLNQHTRREICERAYESGLAFAQLSSMEEAVSSPQHEAREFFVDVEHPSAGRHKYCSAPFRMSATPYVTRRAPTLGEHNEAVYCGQLGLSPAEVFELKMAGVIG
jgi:crotonobetainyl-CoA:carnitine CoA-transferase CaiB-like acyl-CoA transferase